MALGFSSGYHQISARVLEKFTICVALMRCLPHSSSVVSPPLRFVVWWNCQGLQLVQDLIYHTLRLCSYPNLLMGWKHGLGLSGAHLCASPFLLIEVMKLGEMRVSGQRWEDHVAATLVVVATKYSPCLWMEINCVCLLFMQAFDFMCALSSFVVLGCHLFFLLICLGS